MFLRSLTLRNYGIFKDAQFDLRTDVDHPIVLISGNNGAGKTSILEALRVALHGRRAFDVPLGEAEYMRNMGNRFHLGNRSTDCSVCLEFDYVDLHKTRKVKVERSWGLRRQNLAETLNVTLDGATMALEDADDLLCSIVPPEIARYFFFDGERIRELAEWEVEDESALFAAVGDLLGLGVLNQLRTDLIRLASMEQKEQRTTRNTADVLEEAEGNARSAADGLRAARAMTRKIRGALDRARAEVRRVGAMQHDEIAAMENELGKFVAERRSLQEEAQRAAADVLPLLCAKTLRRRFGAEVRARRDIEDREIVTNFFKEKNASIAQALKAHGIKLAAARAAAIEDMAKIARGKPVPVNTSVPSLSRSEAAWMQRVIEQELPDMAKRSRVIVQRLRWLDERIGILEQRRKTAPTNDPAGEAALAELERCQRASVEHEIEIRKLEDENARAEEALEAARGVAKAQRLELFREGRLRVREQVMNQILDALPTLSERLQASKEHRFARYLEDAIRELWHKTDRLVGVDVSFARRRIALLDAAGEINKPDLSSGEKQLFAVAFIYALAKLSSRLMPFVIDTPLGRLDHQHRRRFVAEFLPNASHQVVLLSTDTEIVGSLYEEIRPLIAHHHELAGFNGGATSPVEVATA
jgi:DNA sulfur modification protein DndD